MTLAEMFIAYHSSKSIEEIENELDQSEAFVWYSSSWIRGQPKRDKLEVWEFSDRSKVLLENNEVTLYG